MTQLLAQIIIVLLAPITLLSLLLLPIAIWLLKSFLEPEHKLPPWARDPFETIE